MDAEQYGSTVMRPCPWFLSVSGGDTSGFHLTVIIHSAMFVKSSQVEAFSEAVAVPYLNRHDRKQQPVKMRERRHYKMKRPVFLTSRSWWPLVSLITALRPRMGENPLNNLKKIKDKEKLTPKFDADRGIHCFSTAPQPHSVDFQLSETPCGALVHHSSRRTSKTTWDQVSRNFQALFFANQLRFYIRKCAIIITIKLWPNSLSGHRHTRSWWKNSPDALVSVALRDQPELLQVSESGASDQFALTPLCTWTQWT